MKKHVKNNVHWVGKVDWELQKFHGDEYSTHNGSSYNSYLIQEEKNVLIDTVWIKYADEFVRNLSSEIDLSAIDYIVINHGEIDHSGALPALMEQIPDTPIYCTKNAVKSLKGQYKKDWNFNVVKTGDTLDIGNGKQLVFVEMTMLHWPDSMATYMTQDNILFSNDAFGQHYASEMLFNDYEDECALFEEALKYYANILTPFSAVLSKKLKEIMSLNLTIDIIATSHGILWRKDVMKIVEKYVAWADNYQENQITIIYDTMWEGTKEVAEHIAEGIRIEDPDVKIKIFNIAKADDNDLVSEVFKSKTIVMGSPTVNNSVLRSLAGFTHYLKELKFKNKKAASFGCFGWSGESPKVLHDMLESAGFDMIDTSLKVHWKLNEHDVIGIEFGKAIARA